MKTGKPRHSRSPAKQPSDQNKIDVTNEKKRILWANFYCLMDTSSGASLGAREMLFQLQQSGFEVMVQGATVFDTEKGQSMLLSINDVLSQNVGKFINIEDNSLTHKTLITQDWQRNELRSHEMALWYTSYIDLLDTWTPDLVWFYGGDPTDYLISNEAKSRGIKVAAYLVNPNYHHTRWCRDVDMIITDSEASAQMYKERLGIDCVPVSQFVNPQRCLAPELTRQNLLFINPSLAKGAGLVVQIALLLEKRRPDITIEVVESRGDWPQMVELVTEMFGEKQNALSNVLITSNTADMRPIYGRARILLAPSLWWESAGRVVIESLLNGIPAIITKRGGLPEMGGPGAIHLELPEACFKDPYTTLPTLDDLHALIDTIIDLYDNQERYEALARSGYQYAQQKHSLDVLTDKLTDTFNALLNH